MNDFVFFFGGCIVVLALLYLVWYLAFKQYISKDSGKFKLFYTISKAGFISGIVLNIFISLYFIYVISLFLFLDASYPIISYAILLISSVLMTASLIKMLREIRLLYVDKN